MIPGETWLSRSPAHARPRARTTFLAATRGTALAVAALLAGAAMPAEDSGWQPITADQAHLAVRPEVFGTDSGEFSVQTGGDGRWERWRVRFHDAGRFIQLGLHEGPPAPPSPEAVRQLVRETYPHAGESIRWGSADSVAAGLGTAEIQTFTLAGFGCVAFLIPFRDAGVADRSGTVQGTVCDPVVAELPRQSIEAMLNAVGVRGIHEP